jgi:hemoglobin
MIQTRFSITRGFKLALRRFSYRMSKPRPEITVNRPELKQLFVKAGGEAGLTAILRDFYARMAKDVLIGFFFDGKDTDLIADRQRSFLMRAMGAVPSYTGKPPAQAHENLAPILSGHFDRRLRILEATLKDHGLSVEDIRIWVSFENAFREGIVTVESKK